MTTRYTTINNDILTTNDTGSHCYLKPHDSNMRRISKAEYNRIVEEDKQVREQAAFDETVRNELKKVLDDDFIENAIRDTEESMETEAVREAAENAQGQEKPKRKPTKRIPKSVGHRKTYGETEVILTEKQVDFIRHLPDTCFWEHGLDSAIWVDCLCDDIGGQFRGKPMTVGAMISTLCEKNLGTRGKERVNGRKCTSFALTELGKMVAKDLGL